MQAVGKKNRTSLHSLYDFVLMTRGILCIGTGGPLTRERGDYFASEFPCSEEADFYLSCPNIRKSIAMNLPLPMAGLAPSRTMTNDTILDSIFYYFPPSPPTIRAFATAITSLAF